MRSMNGWASAPTGNGASAHRDRPAGRRRVGRIAAVAITAMLASTLVPGAMAPASADVGWDGTLVNGIPAFFDDGNVKLAIGPPNPEAESFYFSAETEIDGNGNLEVYTAAIESTGPGVAFSRLRIRVKGLVAGSTYTVQHPYGVNTFVAEADERNINFTDDLGCIPPEVACANFGETGANFLGDFKANTTTFLKQDNAPAGTLGNPDVFAPVTGAPSGVNAVIITGPNAGGAGIDTLTVTDFAVQGIIAPVVNGTPSMPDLASDAGRLSTDRVTNATLPTFTGIVDGAGAVDVNLRVDGAAAPAVTTTTVAGAYSVALTAALAPGLHSVVAESAGVSSSPLRFTVETVAPVATLLTRPVNNTPDRTPTFTFTSDDPGATFECQLLPSIPTFAPCTSPMTFAAQIDDDYTFNVRATDVAGNVSAPAPFAWRIGAAVTRLSDFNLDERTDLVARDNAGRLWLHPGTGTGLFQPRRLMGSRGWNVFNAIITPGDVTADGNADLLARSKAGQLWLYPGNGRGGVTAPRLVGSRGWNAMSMIGGAGLMSGDASPDVVARDSAGRLWLYPTTATGSFQTRRLIGRSGWNAMTAIMGAGDLSGDAKADLLARDTAGKLWLYRGNGTGRFATRTPAGTGWQGMTALVTPGNWDRTGGNDLIARDASGTLWLYPGNNAGKLTSRRQIGTGFRGYIIA